MLTNGNKQGQNYNSNQVWLKEKLLQQPIQPPSDHTSVVYLLHPLDEDAPNLLVFFFLLSNNSLYIGTYIIVHLLAVANIKVRSRFISYLSIKAAQRLDQVCGPAYMKDWRGTALLPFADAIIETQQVGKTFWVLKCWECCSLLWALLKMTWFLIKSSWNNFMSICTVTLCTWVGWTWDTSHGKLQSNVVFNSTLAIASRD